MNGTKSNSFELSIWLQKNYSLLLISFLALYILGALFAPFLMHLGYRNTGKFLYHVYGYMCHQYSHRSWFLFGIQPNYPLESTNTIASISEFLSINNLNLPALRAFTGDEITGYKVAICQRDVAIYASLLVFALIFQIMRKKIKRLPLSLWLLFAIVPIGIDGSWQFLSTILPSFPQQFIHESSPILRTITGALFGFFSGWMLLRSIEETISKR